MKKIERRALLCLALAGVLALGMVVFLVLFAVNGSGWAAAPFKPAPLQQRRGAGQRHGARPGWGGALHRG